MKGSMCTLGAWSAVAAAGAVIAPTVTAQCVLAAGFSSGNVVRTSPPPAFGTPPNLFESFATGYDGAEGILQLSQTEVLVASFHLNRVTRFNIQTGLPAGVFSNVAGATGMARWRDQVLVSSFTTGQVVRLSASTGATLGSVMTPGAGGLGSAHGLAVAPDDKLLVANAGSGTVLKYDLISGAFLGVFASGLQQVIDLEFGPDGHLYVATSGGLAQPGSVRRFAYPSAADLGVFVPTSAGLADTHGLQFMDDGSLLILGGITLARADGQTGQLIGALSLPALSRASYVLQLRPLVSGTPVCGQTSVAFDAIPVGNGPFRYQWQWRSTPSGQWLPMNEGVNIDPTTSLPAFSAAGTTAPHVDLTDLLSQGHADRQVRVRVTDDDEPVLCGAAASESISWTICRADFNCQGGLTVQDIFDYLGAYFSGDPAADFNRSGELTVQDVFEFLAAYFTGC